MNVRTKGMVYANLPGTGLGNLLLIWARAKVFSHRNGLPLVTSGWWGIRPGAWFRNEKQKRLYWGYFRESPLHKRVMMQLWKRRYPVIKEPRVDAVIRPSIPVVYQFAEPVSQNELFGSLKPYRSFIIEELGKLLQPKLARQAKELAAPEIALHIRRGDFKRGSTLTPNSFFINCIRFVRSETSSNLRVTVFTDAAKNEISEILQLENVELAEKKPDILDILQMSRSRVMVLSQTSTFSYWAAFLSEATVIKPHGDWYGDIRPEEVNESLFEGTVNFDHPESLLPLQQALRKQFSVNRENAQVR